LEIPWNVIRTHKKMKVSKTDAKLVKKQQVQSCADPLYGGIFW